MHSKLTEAQAERLQMLAEEAGEVVQACMKILRHGFDSYNPHDQQAGSNKVQLSYEIGNLKEIIDLMELHCDLSPATVIEGRVRKRVNMKKYTHHQGLNSAS